MIVIERQFDRERRALADDAFDTDSPAVLLDNLPADAQAQAGAAVAVLVWFFRRVERLENQAELVRSDANACVGDLDLGHAAAAIGSHLGAEAPTAGHRLTSIDHEIEKNL